jgi:acyl-phosphate glycerol 3-phosphate acyltransferase
MAVLGLTILASYLLGAIPFGYLIARWQGVDILRQGSGNIGATNVGRVLGRSFGILVFLLDFAKGAVPVAAAKWLVGSSDLCLPKDSLEVSAGLAAFLGHLFPVYLRFQGGKGVATAAGTVAVLLPEPTLGALLAWVAMASLTRYVSLASLTAAVVLCLLQWGLTTEPLSPDNRILTGFCLVVAGLVFVRHRANINRLLQGNENRLKETQPMQLLTKTIHVLALGLWFGSAVFFTFVATLVIFDTFGSLSAKPVPERPAWLPASFGREQGIQLAGIAVGPIFPWYFLIQGVCGLLAVSTALAWARSFAQQKVHKVRFLILALALATVVAGWPIAQKVSDLRPARYAEDSVVAATAKVSFQTWHTYSLILNLVTLALVTVAMALAARLPESTATADGREAGGSGH